MSNETLDEAGVLAKFGVRADQVLDLLDGDVPPPEGRGHVDEFRQRLQHALQVFVSDGQVNRLDLVWLVERGHGLVVGKTPPGWLRFRRSGLRTGKRTARGQ